MIKKIEHDIDAICQHYLYKIYDEVLTTQSNVKDITKTNGEIFYVSIQKLLKNISLSKDDIIVDLGSGLGKVVSYVFLRSIVKQVIGIELIPELHQQAQWVGNKIKNELPEFFVNNRQLFFIQGDFLQVDLSMASILIINAVCFNQAMMFALGNIINKETNIKTVLTLRPFGNLHRLSLIKIIRVHCSWDSALCYIYGQK